MKKVKFNSTNLESSSMQECNLKETAFENCKLVLSNLF